MKKYKVLVADDDHDFVETLCKRLESAGYDVIFAYDGVRTVQSVYKNHPDLIILDWKMPAGRGSIVLEELKAKNITNRIPIIVLTGVDDPSIKDKAMDLGANAFMRKPYDPPVFLKKVRELLEPKL